MVEGSRKKKGLAYRGSDMSDKQVEQEMRYTNKKARIENAREDAEDKEAIKDNSYTLNSRLHPFTSQVQFGENYAESLESAAKDRLAARDLKKAIYNFKTARDIYNRLASEQSLPVFKDNHDKYTNKASECERQAKRLEKVLKGKWHGLEGKAVAIIGIGGVLLGLFFLSPNITGNVIAGASVKSTSFIGATLFIIGLIAGFFWIKNR